MSQAYKIYRGFDKVRERFQKEKLRKIAHVFLVCLTELRAARSHFDNFGPIAIGFEVLKDEPYYVPPWRGHISAGVLYGEDVVLRRLRGGVARVVAALDGFTKRHPEHSDLARHLAEGAVLRMSALANAISKKGNKVHEREWRIGVIQLPGEHDDAIKVRDLDCHPRRYIELEIRMGLQQPVLRELLIERSYFGRLESVVRNCLRDNSYPPNVPIVAA